MDESATPLLIVGDVHGQADRLSALLLARECAGRRIVFVGDLINRGPHSRRVLDMVLALQSTRSVLVVRGNHEQAAIDVLAGGPIVPLLQMGGAGIILDYVGLARDDVGRQFREAFPESHRNLLQHTVNKYEQGSLVVSHDGRPSGYSSVEAEFSKRRSLTELTIEGKFSVFGHYPQRSARPVLLDHLACVDTGAGSGGPLTALLWPERTYIQR